MVAGGGGGVSSGSGAGAGGLMEGTINVSSSKTYNMVVGQGGRPGLHSNDGNPSYVDINGNTITGVYNVNNNLHRPDENWFKCIQGKDSYIKTNGSYETDTSGIELRAYGGGGALQGNVRWAIGYNDGDSGDRYNWVNTYCTGGSSSGGLRPGQGAGIWNPIAPLANGTQGYAGGNCDSSTNNSQTGGGGGAGGAGIDGDASSSPGAGGPGKSSSISGTSIVYAQGGGGH